MGLFAGRKIQENLVFTGRILSVYDKFFNYVFVNTGHPGLTGHFIR